MRSMASIQEVQRVGGIFSKHHFRTGRIKTPSYIFSIQSRVLAPSSSF